MDPVPPAPGLSSLVAAPSPPNAQLTEAQLLTISLRSAASAESRLMGRRGPG